VRLARLHERHAAGLEELLLDDPIVNLFLLGYMDAVPLHRAHWHGALDGDRVVGVALVIPGRLLVPWCPDPEVARRIGALLRRRYRASMMVGPREACDALWSTWAPDVVPLRWHDQRLLVCDSPVVGEPLEGFRRARPEEAAEIARLSAAMEEEDIGRRPLEEDPTGFLAVVARRIEHGQTWVVERDRHLVFCIHVGTTTGWGVQVGGTYVPPSHRGRGLAKAGMAELGRRLLARHPRITLHVNAANLPAMGAYLATNYQEHALFRLVTVGRTT
jgi:predicted GNAT family acetyltransferase